MSALDKLDYQTLFESAPGLYLAMLPDYRIIAVSDAYLKATLTKREEILGRSVFEVFPDNPSNPTATGVRNLRVSLERVLKNHAPDTMAVQKYDVRRPLADGGGFEEKYWSVVNSPVVGEDGCVRFIMHRAEDVTEFMRLKLRDIEQSRHTENLEARFQEIEAEVFLRAQEVQRANEKLEEANQRILKSERLKDEFIANVSHELRTPLTLIMAPLESLLTSSSVHATEECALLRTMHNNALRLLQMITGLLDFSRLQAGKISVDREPMDINSLTQSMLADFQTVLQQKKLGCEFEKTGEKCLVESDRYLYERILFNLLSNAIKFTPEGGRLRVCLQQDDDSLKLCVSDSGIGISEDQQKHLFERFHQAEGSSTRRFEGAGLGLALVREFAELLDGTVSVQSKLGEGTTFTVRTRAPRTTAEAKSCAGKRVLPITTFEPLHPVSPSQIARSMSARVVIAEDNPELANYIVGLVRPESEVRVASNGVEAFEIVKTWNPDLVLADIMMPEMNGITLCKKIKAEPRTAGVSVVLLTALVHREALLQGWEAGADEYLFKPFHPTELVARVKSLLSGAEVRKQRDHEKKRRAELEDFTYFASHDLREPLRMLTSFSQLLKKRYGDKLGPDADLYIRHIVESAGRMDELINSLIHYSELLDKRIPLERVSCNRALSGALGNLSLILAESGANVSASELPEVHGSEVLLAQVFQNLLANAVKYRSAAPPEITIDAQRSGAEWLFSVRDNGIGFERQYAERIFMIFKRLHSREEYPGIGVGLAICKSVVERHGGRIWAESEQGKGSVFYFTLPVDSNPAAQLSYNARANC